MPDSPEYDPVEFQSFFEKVGAAVFNPKQPATFKFLCSTGRWKQKKTNLATARAWRAYFERQFPDVRTDLIIHLGETE